MDEDVDSLRICLLYVSTLNWAEAVIAVIEVDDVWAGKE